MLKLGNQITLQTCQGPPVIQLVTMVRPKRQNRLNFSNLIFNRHGVVQNYKFMGIKQKKGQGGKPPGLSHDRKDSGY